jgi:drug/metabolite transporter (DMT)-like permease
VSPMYASSVALLAGFAWGLGNVSQKTILENLDGFSATGFTSLLGAVVLLPFMARELKVKVEGIWNFLLQGILVALLFTAAATLMQFGYGHTTVSNAGFMVNTSAVLTPTIACIVFKEKLPLWTWPAGFSTLLGVFIMSGGAWNSVSLGDVLCLFAAAAFGLWALFLGRHVMQYRRPIMLTVLQLMFCGAATMLLGIIFYGPPQPFAVIAALPDIIVVGAISKGLAYVLSAKAQQHISASCAMVIVSSEAVFGAAFAVILLGEGLTVSRVLGASFVLLGVVIVSLQPFPGRKIKTALQPSVPISPIISLEDADLLNTGLPR